MVQLPKYSSQDGLAVRPCWSTPLAFPFPPLSSRNRRSVAPPPRFVVRSDLGIGSDGLGATAAGDCSHREEEDQAHPAIDMRHHAGEENHAHLLSPSTSMAGVVSLVLSDKDLLHLNFPTCLFHVRPPTSPSSAASVT